MARICRHTTCILNYFNMEHLTAKEFKDKYFKLFGEKEANMPFPILVEDYFLRNKFVNHTFFKKAKNDAEASLEAIQHLRSNNLNKEGDKMVICREEKIKHAAKLLSQSNIIDSEVERLYPLRNLAPYDKQFFINHMCNCKMKYKFDEALCN